VKINAALSSGSGKVRGGVVDAQRHKNTPKFRTYRESKLTKTKRGTNVPLACMRSINRQQLWRWPTIYLRLI
jgi:hypothetical protein